MAKKEISTPKKWQGSLQTTKALQVAFDVGVRVQKAIRHQALESGLSPSDQVRSILGLDVQKKPQRPRLSISLTEDDFAILAEKFALDKTDKLMIKQKAAEVLIAYVDDVDDAETQA